MLLPKYSTDSKAGRDIQRKIRDHRKVNQVARFYVLISITDWGLGLRIKKASPLTGFLACATLQLLFVEVNLYLWGIINKKWIRKYAAARTNMPGLPKSNK